MKTNSIIAITT